MQSFPLIKIPSEAKDAWHPDTYKNGLAFVLKKEPNAYAENKTEKCCDNKEISTFHFFFFGGFRVKFYERC